MELSVYSIGFKKSKWNFLFAQKKCGNKTNLYILFQQFWELNENVLIRSWIWFRKSKCLIFSGTKAQKWKLSILKKCWFDITTYTCQVCSTSNLKMDITFTSIIWQMFPIKQNFCNNENFCKTEISQIFVKFDDISHFRKIF